MLDPADPRFAPLPPAFYQRPAQEVARGLLGRYLVRHLPSSGDLPAERLVLRLVETEAYLGEGDRASHASKGPVTERSRRLHRDGGHAYVYLIYGMHHCMNAVSGTEDDGTAVLLRAGEAVSGAERMRSLRGRPRGKLGPGDLAGGPGKLCQALAIGPELDGVPLWEGELQIATGEPVGEAEVATGPRIGVDYAGPAAAWPLRYGIRGHREMSRPRLG